MSEEVSGNEEPVEPNVEITLDTGQIIKGHSMRVVRLDAEGNPLGEPIWINEDWTPGTGEPIEDITFEVFTGDAVTVDLGWVVTSNMVLALIFGQRWPISEVLCAMGAQWEFDYADLPSDEQAFDTRLTRCYEIASTALVMSDAVRSLAHGQGLPMPEALIHGKWSSPETRDDPIHHAWILLDDGRIWEPISKTVCDAEQFTRYTQCVSHTVYTGGMAAANMLRSGHHGPWY